VRVVDFDQYASASIFSAKSSIHGAGIELHTAKPLVRAPQDFLAGRRLDGSWNGTVATANVKSLRAPSIFVSWLCAALPIGSLRDIEAVCPLKLRSSTTWVFAPDSPHYTF